MSAAGHPESTPTDDDVAERCRDAGLVRLLAAPDGDALAAVGLLAQGLADRDVAFQASVGHTTTSATEADVTVAVGRSGGDVALAAEPVAVAAHEIVRALGSDPDPVLALAGVTAAGGSPDAHPDLLAAVGVERDAGVAVPGDDLADGLAHTTLLHAPFSGDPEAAAEALAALDRDGRAVASLAALSAVVPGADAGEDDSEAPARRNAAVGSRAATAVERAVHPYRTPGAPFATLGGYGDVLEAVARERPGVGVGMAIGSAGADLRTAALAAWRDHARAAHRAVSEATRARYDGLLVADVPSEIGTALPTAARLLRDYRSPEPVVLARSGGTVAVAADRDVADLTAEAAAVVGGRADGRGNRATARIDESDREAFVTALKRAL